ncbi:MAG: hypothetical protein UZ19_OD1000059 [Parcubacteria bacterium OLB19]|nr:MAG: hypothetical protein UZ19_OD1000059 [Parcubacteria bacterium OLB19]
MQTFSHSSPWRKKGSGELWYGEEVGDEPEKVSKDVKNFKKGFGVMPNKIIVQK